MTIMDVARSMADKRRHYDVCPFCNARNSFFPYEEKGYTFVCSECGARIEDAIKERKKSGQHDIRYVDTYSWGR